MTKLLSTTEMIRAIDEDRALRFTTVESGEEVAFINGKLRWIETFQLFEINKETLSFTWQLKRKNYKFIEVLEQEEFVKITAEHKLIDARIKEIEGMDPYQGRHLKQRMDTPQSLNIFLKMLSYHFTSAQSRKILLEAKFYTTK